MDYLEARRLFADKIGRLRREKNITQDELAEIIDKTTDYISLLERAERSPSFEVILDLAEALDVPPAYLLSFGQTGEVDTFFESIIAAPVGAGQTCRTNALLDKRNIMRSNEGKN